jgi:hypothetical protein
MALYDYSYSTVDPQTGVLRTFRITTDSRPVALIEIRRAVMAVNRERMAAGSPHRLAIPESANLYADAPSRARQAPAATKVALYA